MLSFSRKMVCMDLCSGSCPVSAQFLSTLLFFFLPFVQVKLGLGKIFPLKQWFDGAFIPQSCEDGGAPGLDQHKRCCCVRPQAGGKKLSCQFQYVNVLRMGSWPNQLRRALVSTYLRFRRSSDFGLPKLQLFKILLSGKNPKNVPCVISRKTNLKYFLVSFR